jgi:hypothetical protein
MMQLFEVVLIEVVEEFPRPWRLRADVQVVDMRVPVLTNRCVV